MFAVTIALSIAHFLTLAESAPETKSLPPLDCSTVDTTANCHKAENARYAVFEPNFWCSMVKSLGAEKAPKMKVKCQAKQAVACGFGWIESAAGSSDPIDFSAVDEVPPGMYKISKADSKFYVCRKDPNNEHLITVEWIALGTSNAEKTEQEHKLTATLTKMWSE